MRSALAPRLDEKCHIFTNVFHVWGNTGSEVHQYFANAELTYEQQVSLAFDLPCLESMWCERHAGYCCLCTGAGSRVGGFPCVDFSTAGNQAGVNGKESFPTLLAFGARARAAKNPVVGIENVPGCPPETVHDAMGSMFTFGIQQVVQPADVGINAISRSRQEISSEPSRNGTVYAFSNL